jgi:antitoxin YefM
MLNYLAIAEAQEQLPALSKKFRDREFMSELREGIRQADLGQMISLEVLKLELGF